MFWLLGGLGGGAQAAQEPPTYSVLVTPQLAPEIMHQGWAPLLDAVTRETGIKFAPMEALGLEKFLVLDKD